MNAREQADEIILPPKREHRVDQIVPDTGFALLDFEAVGEEVEKSADQQRYACFGVIIVPIQCFKNRQ